MLVIMYITCLFVPQIDVNHENWQNEHKRRRWKKRVLCKRLMKSSAIYIRFKSESIQK